MKIDHLNFNLIAVIALPQLVLFIKIYMSRYRRVLKILITVKYKYFLYFASQFASVIPLSVLLDGNFVSKIPFSRSPPPYHFVSPTTFSIP